jgi:hypothetical protein
MITFFIIMFAFVALLTYAWVRGIDGAIKHKEENPNTNMSEGWLDWDEDKAHTEDKI